MLKKAFSAVLACLLVASFVACSSSASSSSGAAASQGASSGTASSTAAANGEQTSLTLFYHIETLLPGMEAIAEAFMAENPDITVINELVTADHVTVLKSKDAAGQLPEIFVTGTYGESALKPYIDAGKIVDVSELTVVKNLDEDVKNGLRFSDGGIYNIPFNNTPMGVMYNKTLFEAAGITETPKTFDEFKEVAQKLKDYGATPFVVAAKDGWPVGSQIWVPCFQQLTPNEWNTAMYTGEESFATTSKPIFEMIDFVRENALDGAMETDYMTSLALYTEGDIGMMFYSPNVYPNLAELDQEVADNTGYFAVPLSNKAEENKCTTFSTVMWQVSSQANFEAVDRFFNFIVDGPGKEIYAEQIFQPNPYGIPYDADPINAEAAEIMANGNYFVDYQSMNEPEGFWQVVSTATQEYYAGMKTMEETIAALDKGWADIVSGS